MSQQKNPLDKELDATWKHPDTLRQASEEVTGAVELGWAAAKTLFGKQAKPQHAIELAKLFLAQAAHKTPLPDVAKPAGPPVEVDKGRPRQQPDEVDSELAPQAPSRSRKTAQTDEPPRAVSKAGRPARM